MKIWTVANQKGGVGKTTSAVALAGLAAEQGLRVLMIDLDPQGSLTSYFGENADECRLSTYRLFELNKQMTADNVRAQVSATAYPNLQFIAASTALATLERQAIGKDGLGLVIKRALELIKADYDLAIIDSPPILGVLMINALAACEQLVIPVQTEFLAIKGLERMVHTLAMLGRSRKSALQYTIVPTMFDRRTQASLVSLRAIKNEYPEHAWANKITVDTSLRDASKAGIPPHLYNPDGRAVGGYRSLLKHLLQQSGLASNSTARGPVAMAGGA